MALPSNLSVDRFNLIRPYLIKCGDIQYLTPFLEEEGLLLKDELQEELTLLPLSQAVDRLIDFLRARNKSFPLLKAAVSRALQQHDDGVKQSSEFKQLYEVFQKQLASNHTDEKLVILQAFKQGDINTAKKLLPQIADPAALRDASGRNLLHFACKNGWKEIVKELILLHKLNPNLQDDLGQSPLHAAASANQTDVVAFMLSTGMVNPFLATKACETPQQLATDENIVTLFAKFANCLPVNSVSVRNTLFVFGSPAAGKSTLVKVIENKVTSRFGNFAGQFRNISGVEIKTAGINTVTIQSSRLGTVTVYDLAGQFEYYSLHDALVGNLMSSLAAIFIVVVKFSESEAEVIRTLQYWISFIENCCSTLKATGHLLVVGSWADKVKQSGENVDQKWSVIKKACISSSSPLYFVGFAALDCRKLASGGLDRVCEMIEFSCTALKEAKALEQKEIIYPHLLHSFINTKLQAQVACSVRELYTLITAEDDSLLPTEPSLLSPLLSSVSDGGHLLYLPNKEDFEAGWVIVDRRALLSEINGTIFAPENFKQHHDIATSTGVVPKSKVAGVFTEKYSIDMILSVLTLFELCHKINDSFTLSLIADNEPSRDIYSISGESSESYYFFPALVRVEHPTSGRAVVLVSTSVAGVCSAVKKGSTSPHGFYKCCFFGWPSPLLWPPTPPSRTEPHLC